MLKSITDIILLYYIINKLTTPFTEWQAFKTGVIDKDGNVIVKKSQRNVEQRDSISMFDVFIMNMKKLVNKLPGGNSKIALLTAAYLLKEEKFDSDLILNETTDSLQDVELIHSIVKLTKKMKENPEAKRVSELFSKLPRSTNDLGNYFNEHIYPIYNKDPHNFENNLQKHWSTIREEVAVNSIGGGNISGSDDGVKYFAGNRTFDVDRETINKSLLGKHPRHRYERYLKGDVLKTVRDYAKTRKSIVLRHANTGEMIFLKR